MATANEILAEQLETIKTQIAEYSTAITFLIANPTESYTLDTGQSTQTVRRANLIDLQNARRGLMNEMVVLENRLNGGGGFTGYPTC